MIFKYIVLIYGILEFLFGSYIWIFKNEIISKLIINTLSVTNKAVSYDNIKDKKEFVRWIGGIIIIGGCLYIFLASASIYFNINSIFIIIFIVSIESFIFKTMIKGVKDFL